MIQSDCNLDLNVQSSVQFNLGATTKSRRTILIIGLVDVNRFERFVRLLIT